MGKHFLKDLPDELHSSNPLSFETEQNSSIKVLGLYWDSYQDSFFYKVSPIDRAITKRNLLSELARIFDPLGFLAPVTFLCKYLIQKLWILGLDWDDTPDQEIIRVWLKYRDELSLLSNIRVPRYFNFDSNDLVEMHAFADASERGYGTAIYLKVIREDDIQTYLVCSKSKVAPCSKKISIARMELCAAVLLTKVVRWVKSVFKDNVKLNKIHAYSDSQIVLAWLRANPNRWQTFVANRVAYIQEEFDFSNWSYIKSQLNPADAVSRGLFPSELLSNRSWFEGPEFLRTLKWTPENIEVDTSEEERKVVLFIADESHILDTLLNNISSFSRLRNIVL